jgi:hypothetical protein
VFFLSYARAGGLFVIFVLPFFVKSANGAEGYILNRWDANYTVFLLGWMMGFVFLISYLVAKNLARALIQFGLMLGSIYFICLIISLVLWHNRSSDYISGTVHAMVRDPEFMIRNKPFYRFTGLAVGDLRSSEDHAVTVNLDAEGFRNESQRSDKIDIAFIGDSFTFGAQVNYDELFSTILSKELNLRGGNYGINGTGQGTQLQILKKIVIPKKPKLVVLQLFDNDPTENYAFYIWANQEKSKEDIERWPVGRLEFEKEYPFSSNFRFKLLLEILKKELFRPWERSAGFKIDFKDKTVHFQTAPYENKLLLLAQPALAAKIFNCPARAIDYEKCSDWVKDSILQFYPEAIFDSQEAHRYYYSTLIAGVELLTTRDLLNEFITACEQNGVKLVVVRISGSWMTYRSRLKPVEGSPKAYFQAANLDFPGLHSFDEVMGGYCRSRNVKYLSTLDAWKEADDFYYWRYEPHLNPAGHRAIAVLLKNEITFK